MAQNKILVVDDEPKIQLLLTNYFSNRGNDVRAVPSGEDALEMMEFWNPDLIFLDIQLPHLNGMDVLKRIKMMNDGIPVVMISGYATEKMAIKSLELGAMDYINKPINFKRLEEIVTYVSSVKES
ncbi:MAG: response regulator transcription factor [Candidatus Zhuqueibacterota bacterium]